jgi:hypothetical protein
MFVVNTADIAVCIVTRLQGGRPENLGSIQCKDIGRMSSIPASYSGVSGSVLGQRPDILS